MPCLACLRQAGDGDPRTPTTEQPTSRSPVARRPGASPCETTAVDFSMGRQYAAGDVDPRIRDSDLAAMGCHLVTFRHIRLAHR